MIVNETRDYANSYQSKIFREISALKFQQQHAAQFRYDGLCSETKTEIHCGCFLRNFRTATFENNFGGLLLKKKQRKRMMVSGVYFFQGIY